MPSVAEALQRLERELVLLRQQRSGVVKFIHGYGSSGVGGDIRIAVQKRLRELKESGELRECIFERTGDGRMMRAGNTERFTSAHAKE